MSNHASTIYWQCGMRMRSAIELHLPTADRSGPVDWDVDVRWGEDAPGTDAPPVGEVVAEYETHAEGWWYRAVARDDGYCVRFRGVGDFRISAALDTVTVSPDPDGERQSLIPVLMAGTVSSLLLALRGATVLHASAVAWDGRALAFVGQSGRGKTTMAALMCVHGAALVTDDVLAVDPGPPATCTGGAAELRLREKAASLAGARSGTLTRTTVDDRLALTMEQAPLRPMPLSAIVVPWPSREAKAVEVELIDPSDALMAMIGMPRIHGWKSKEVLNRDFVRLSAVANSVPLYSVLVPWGPPFDPSIVDTMRSLVTPS